MEGDRRRRRQLALLGHRPIVDAADDVLGFEDYASAIAELLDDPMAGRTVVAVNGPPGSGKSSLGHLIERKLRDRRSARRPVFWFDAWMHDDADNLAGAFVARLLLATDPHRSTLRRWLRPLPLGLIPPGERVRRWIPLLVFLGTLVGIVLGLLGISFPDLLQSYLLPAAGGAGLLAVSARFVFTTAGSVAAFVRNPEVVAGTGALEKVRDQLASFIRQATPADLPFVVIVDDLDRVRAPAAVDVLEAIDQLLPNDVAVVLLAEVDALVASAEIKYPAAAKRSSHYGERYVERIVPVQFDLPWRNPAWSSAFLERRAENYDGADARVSEAVAPFINGDHPLPPRRIKRVLSRVRLSMSIAERRGLLAPGTGIEPAHIGKWVLIQERWPGLADHFTSEPMLLDRLESCADDEALAEALESEIDASAAENQRIRGLLRAEPKLGGVARALVLFEAPDPPPSP